MPDQRPDAFAGRAAGTPQQVLDAAFVADAVFALRPDYRVLLLAVEGIAPGPCDERSESVLVAAEAEAARLLAESPVDELPHVAAWREALTRRAEAGLPRVNRLTDVYNAVSVLHQVPVGGEDLTRYVGAPRLVRATGAEPFDTVADGAEVVEQADPGEVVWCDEAGVTCRRWNWRQGRRTRLTPATSTALFIFDALAPLDDAALEAAADELVELLPAEAAGLRVARRLIGPD